MALVVPLPLLLESRTSTVSDPQEGQGRQRRNEECRQYCAVPCLGKARDFQLDPSMSLAQTVTPGVSKRDDYQLVGDKCALLIIDVQKHLSEDLSSSQEMTAEKRWFYEDACPAAVDNIVKIVEAFRLIRDDPAGRKSGYEVLFTYLQSATKDGRDISLDYKLSGSQLSKIPHVGTDYDDVFIEALQPDPVTGKGDILLPKTSCNVFVSTRLDYLLRNLGIEQLVVVGQLTDECVESAVRSAADLGYFVTVVADACASKTPEKHQKGLDGMRGFARILKTSQMMDEVVEGLALDIEGHSAKSATDGEVNDEVVLDYLRSKGMHKAAQQVAMMFSVQGIATKESPSKVDDSKAKRKSENRRKSVIKKLLNGMAESKTNGGEAPAPLEGSFSVHELVGKPGSSPSPPPQQAPPSPSKSPKKNKKVVESESKPRIDMV